MRLRFSSSCSSAARRASFSALAGRYHMPSLSSFTSRARKGVPPVLRRQRSTAAAWSFWAGCGASSRYTTAAKPSFSAFSLAPSSETVRVRSTGRRENSRRNSSRARGSAALAAAVSASVRTPNIAPSRLPVR